MRSGSREVRPSAWRLSLALVLFAFVVGACDENRVLGLDEPTLVGEIVDVGDDLGPSLSIPGILREAHIDDPDDADECGIIFSVTETTRIFVRGSDGSLRGGALGDLRVGATARARAVDGVAESCPAQALADWIVIVAD